MLKYIVLAFIALFAFAHAAPAFSVGQYNWFSDSPCSVPVIVNLTYANGQYSSSRSSDNSPYLRNVTVNSDNTFTGLGTLYKPGTSIITGTTTVKGVINNPFNFMVVYNPSTNPYYAGSNNYYNLVSCSMATEDHDLHSGRFETI
ncbi:hypothetical protein PPL_07259 [Heterostelium album PN500]|uniref:Uncharacterized protein n=1 Tax=Heterostelium pallidum (strain ATCC 26659 / Pp 5 / PN500) TaxID=670386 RepID=D3BEU4_HETP5|nr:hypothetical protein PPL_07259 [Heterostelium album PN500]EFA80425.1 hypothetical protein PPL_07259 [Heterostelium album PN500]|eukprot:XP_020432545.1 hypothetical protein PPL_07259 [Heterostelium album PN500]